MKKILVRFGLWLARLGGWTPEVCTLPHLPVDENVAVAKKVIQEVEEKFRKASGIIKAREAQRTLSNIFPDAKPRDLNLLIEIALND